ncbi:hypothetical protein MRX96_019453 [Rhipicephalus microplus]
MNGRGVKSQERRAPLDGKGSSGASPGAWIEHRCGPGLLRKYQTACPSEGLFFEERPKKSYVLCYIDDVLDQGTKKVLHSDRRTAEDDASVLKSATLQPDGSSRKTWVVWWPKLWSS